MRRWMLMVLTVICIFGMSGCGKTADGKGDVASGDLPPMLVMGNCNYIAREMPVSELPENFECMGEITEQEANDTGLQGCKYYANKYISSFDEFYVYQECGTPIDENTVDPEQRQWAYVKWVREGFSGSTEIVKTLQSDFKTYYEMSDGTWQCDGYSYKYRLVISGRMNEAVPESTFVYLSNIKDIPFEQAWKASGFSSSLDDYFAIEDAVFVGWK